MPQEGTAQVVRNLPRFDDPDLIVGAEGFSDAGVYRLREDLLIVQSLDFFPPLVDDPFTYGQIAAANGLSDVLAMGARPVTALNIVGFPDDQLPLDLLGQILAGGAERVKQAGAVIAGGHTVRDQEIKYGLSVTGVVEPDKLLTNSKAQPGDVLVLTKALGTGFVTTAFKAGKCPGELLQAAVASMVQLNQVGPVSVECASAHAVTDITGFGLAGHACELAQASHVTLQIELQHLPVLPGVAALVESGFQTRASASNRHFVEPMLQLGASVDPIRLELAFDAQTSGGLLISVPADGAERLIAKARTLGAEAACRIGSVCEKQDAALVLA